MYAPCATHKRLSSYDDPLATRWYNCKDDGEARPLLDQESVNDFKKLCPSMYTNDFQPLCCNPEQLSILKKDILAAQALMGSCSSCFFNFRQLWCHFTCSPDQANFVIPNKIIHMIKTNFTDKLVSYNNANKNINDSPDYSNDYGKFKNISIIIKF